MGEKNQHAISVKGCQTNNIPSIFLVSEVNNTGEAEEINPNIQKALKTYHFILNGFSI